MWMLKCWPLQDTGVRLSGGWVGSGRPSKPRMDLGVRDAVRVGVVAQRREMGSYMDCPGELEGRCLQRVVRGRAP